MGLHMACTSPPKVCLRAEGPISLSPYCDYNGHSPCTHVPIPAATALVVRCACARLAARRCADLVLPRRTQRKILPRRTQVL
jgi:hypothetical protein